MTKTEGKTSWTPGPWEYGEDRRGRKRVFAGSREIVRALTAHGTRRIPAAEREANARLIAAAPDLYEALAELVEVAGGGKGFFDKVDRARAALSRARRA